MGFLDALFGSGGTSTTTGGYRRDVEPGQLALLRGFEGLTPGAFTTLEQALMGQTYSPESPQVQDYIGSLTNEIVRNYQRNIVPQITQQGIQSGAFFGSGTERLRRDAESGLNRDIGNIVNQVLGNLFQQREAARLGAAQSIFGGSQAAAQPFARQTTQQRQTPSLFGALGSLGSAFGQLGSGLQNFLTAAPASAPRTPGRAITDLTTLA